MNDEIMMYRRRIYTKHKTNFFLFICYCCYNTRMRLKIVCVIKN